MANTVIALKKSSTPSAVPGSLANGELAINFADGKLFYKASNGTIASISSGSLAFGTVNANGTLVVADTTSDVFDLVSGEYINITGDAINDKITISANISLAYDRANAAWELANTANAGGGGASVTVSTSPPGSPSQGDLWWDDVNGTLKIYYDDGTSSQWVDAVSEGAFTGLANTSDVWFGGNLNISGDVTISGNTTINGLNSGYAPNRPAFRAWGSGTTNNLTTTQNGTGCLTANNWTLDFNQGGYLANTNGVFTAPVTGLYQVNIVGRNSGYSSGISQLGVTKNGSSGGTVGGTCIMMVEFAASSSMNHAGASTVIKLVAGDTLACKILAGEINFDGNDNWSVSYIG